jgi:hypothetical protein
VAALAAAVLAALGVCAVALSRPHRGRPDSGIRGQVLYGPTCPVQRAGETCTRPYQATIRVLREPGDHQVAAPRSHPDGRFSVRLSAGRYRLEPERGHPLPRAQPQTVSVHRHRFTHVVINYDSGIR